MSQLFLLATFGEKLKTFYEEGLIVLLQNILIAIVIFLIGKKIAQLLTFGAVKMMQASKFDDTLVKFLKAVIYIGLMVIVFISALDALGINTTSFAAVLAAAGLAVGMALKDTLGNFAAGVMIILFKPYKVGDTVEIAGTMGTVLEIHIFNTKMKTGDNILMYIPNGNIVKTKICNYSAQEKRRVDLLVGCGYNDDLKAVKEFLVELVHNHEKIARDPEPVIAVSELGDSSVNFIVRAWVDTPDYWKVKWDLTEKVKLGFDEKGFTIPFPQRDVHIYQETTEVKS